MPAPRPFPRRTLEQALRVPRALKEYNGGNAWPSGDVAGALDLGPRSGNFFYISAASQFYGLTEGTRDTREISLTDLGRRAVYPQSDRQEQEALVEAFLRVEPFRAVLEHYGGDNLPEQRFLANTLQTEMGIEPEWQDEFVDLFQKNTRFLGIGAEFRIGTPLLNTSARANVAVGQGNGSVEVAAPEGDENAPVCFVIMPFVERDDAHQIGFFAEVLKQIFTPAGTQAGFRVKTAARQGSDVIQSTIVNDLLQADLVLADLTEHNPNVLFELGMRMNEDKPVALVRARGTGPIFDVDNMLRVEDYSPNLWPTTVERDVPKIRDHIKATWDNRESGDTFMRILRRRDNGGPSPGTWG
jgi:hypothetical protein